MREKVVAKSGEKRSFSNYRKKRSKADRNARSQSGARQRNHKLKLVCRSIISREYRTEKRGEARRFFRGCPTGKVFHARRILYCDGLSYPNCRPFSSPPPLESSDKRDYSAGNINGLSFILCTCTSLPPSLSLSPYFYSFLERQRSRPRILC